MQLRDVGLRKRQQIAQSGRAMFFWVAGVSVVLGFAAVLSWFLVQQSIYRTKVVDEKNRTLSKLEESNKAMDDLKSNVRALEVNAGLNSVKAKPDDNALQVILDALPADRNSLALGASLQNKLVTGIDGLNIESLVVKPVDTKSKSNSGKIAFRLVVSSADANALKELLKRFERSIRVIDLETLNLERGETKYSLTVDAHAYYEPETKVELKEKVVNP